MERGMNKVVLVTRRTRLQELVAKYNTMEQAKFYIEHLGADFSDYIREDRIYQKAVQEAAQTAEKYARLQRIDRDFLPNMIFGKEDSGGSGTGRTGGKRNEVSGWTAADRR